MANVSLKSAKNAKNDEFYTQWSDIEREINAYVEYNPKVFKGKIILLPADDPFESNFFKFFATKFNEYGLKKLIATSYAPSPIVNTQISLLPEIMPDEDIVMTRSIKQAYKIELTEVADENGSGVINIDDVITRLLIEKKLIDNGGQSEILTYLEGDANPNNIDRYSAGDFRSEEVTNVKNESDVIITNPPFSLFREFLNWVEPEKRNVLVIGNMNAITYKEVFPLIKDNKLWIGNGFHAGNAFFKVENPREFAKGVYDEKTGLVKFRNVIWFSNLDHGKRHQPLSLMTMEENIKFSKHKNVKEVGYTKYDNYDAIEVPFTDAIPSDYIGIMGVPISFLEKYNPVQFEILGITQRNDDPYKIKRYTTSEYKNANDLNARATIWVDGILKSVYARILIKKRK